MALLFTPCELTLITKKREKEGRRIEKKKGNETRKLRTKRLAQTNTHTHTQGITWMKAREFS